MADPEPVESAAFDDMLAAGHALLTLSLMEEGHVLNEREEQLVNTAVVAGVLGALDVYGAAPPESRRDTKAGEG